MDYTGKKARIIANTNDHGFDIGEVVYLTFKKAKYSDEVLLAGSSIDSNTPAACYLDQNQFVLIESYKTNQRAKITGSTDSDGFRIGQEVYLDYFNGELIAKESSQTDLEIDNGTWDYLEKRGNYSFEILEDTYSRDQLLLKLEEYPYVDIQGHIKQFINWLS